MTETIKVALSALDPDAIERAVAILRDGGLVVYPTRCLYGLGADAANPAAVEKVFAAKGRSLNQPISVICRDEDCLRRIVRRIPPQAEPIMKRYWPGSVTLVLEANAALPALLTAGLGKIGIRLPANPVAAALVEGLGRPVTATSANLSGAAGCHRVEDLPRAILERIDLVLDAGPLEGGLGSTVVDVTGPVPVILREGVVSAHELKGVLGRVF